MQLGMYLITIAIEYRTSWHRSNSAPFIYEDKFLLSLPYIEEILSKFLFYKTNTYVH